MRRIAITAVLILLAAGFWWWDANRGEALFTCNTDRLGDAEFCHLLPVSLEYVGPDYDAAGNGDEAAIDRVLDRRAALLMAAKRLGFLPPPEAAEARWQLKLTRERARN